MAKIVVERPHTLGREVARARAEQLAERLASQYDLRYQWQGDVLEFKRKGADGSIQVGDDQVRVELSLGLLLSALGGTIKREIEKGLDESLRG
ncbi:MAG: polyhydroxyalkanoic acid system family protein [Pseudomonas sp.]|uniref:polyhydroxyalkanoic acid system family protein n=1 Tax=Pseudomonas sp. TaxID=306 RepID=UPI0033933E4D